MKHIPVFALVFLYLCSLVLSCNITGNEINLQSYFTTSDLVLSASLLSGCPFAAESIDLSNNHFTTVDVDAFKSFYSLKKITLTNNQIVELPVGLFTQPFRMFLEEVYVNQNQISYLNNSLFEHNSVLNTIDLSENRISFIDTNVFHEGLQHLLLVNMSFNKMKYFEPWPYVPDLLYDKIFTVFDFQYNLIEAFTNKMNWTYNLKEPNERYVNLQFNKLAKLGNDSLFQYRQQSNDLSILTEFLTYRMNISHNQFFCDCKLFDITNDLHKSFFLYYRVDQYRMRCVSPSNFAGIDFLHDFEMDQFICNITDKCPSNCTCQEQPYISTLVINCTNANLHEIPKIIPDMSGNIRYVSLYLNGNSITEIIKRNYSNIIKNMTLSNNYLSYIDGDALKQMDNLDLLDISYNYLNFLPKEIQKFSFAKVTVRGNHFECKCNMTWMSDWISLSKNAKDADITCSFEGETKIISEVSEDSLNCNIENFIIIFSVVTAVVVGIIIAVIVTAKRCPYETKVLIYRFTGVHPRDRYKVDNSEQMLYDGYLSYDGEDIQVRQWIKTIFMKKLEANGKKKYSFFCPDRDALAGDDYGNDLVNKMSRSRRVFILLSPGYFKQEWRIYESDQAEMEHNNDETHARVIYLLWNDKNEEIKRNLANEPWKSRLIGKKVLSPDKRFFWSKVRYELPVKPKNKVFCQNSANINNNIRQTNRPNVFHAPFGTHQQEEDDNIHDIESIELN